MITRMPSSSHRISSSAVPRPPGCWCSAVNWCATPYPPRREAERWRSSTRPNTATSTTPSPAKRAARPAIVESIRAGLVFALKDAVGPTSSGNENSNCGAVPSSRWQHHPNIEILGHPHAQRLSIVSFRVRSGAQRYLHHNFVVALLNDLFGIQARGGCSCAGPYGHRLLTIDAQHSRAYRDEIELGCEGIKPGWTRINFNYFISDTVRDYLIDAVELLAGYGHRLLTDYTFSPDTGLWHHRVGPPRPPFG